MNSLANHFKNAVGSSYYFAYSAYKTLKQFVVSPPPFEKLMEAIQKRHTDQIEWELCDKPVLNIEQEDQLLNAAIRTDDLKVFKLALKKFANDDVNYCLYEQSTIWASDVIWESDLVYKKETAFLYAAIEAGSQTIAKWLAKNPNTHFEYSGFSAVGARRDVFPRPIDAAQDKGMKDVVRILMSRMQELSQQQASTRDLSTFDF